MNAKAIVNFIHEIKNVWSRSDNEEAQKRAETLSSILENGIPIVEEWENELKCAPPSLELTNIDISSQLSNNYTKEMYAAFVEGFGTMPWKYPRQLSNALTDILGEKIISRVQC